MTQELSRRTLAKGAAWAAPAVVVASATPVMAASCDEACSSINDKLKFGGALNGNNWKWTSALSAGSWSGDTAPVWLSTWNPSGAGSGNTCYPNCPDNAAGLSNGVILFGGQPQTVSAWATSYMNYASATFCVKAGITYTFTINYTYYGCSGNVQKVNIDLMNGTSVYASLGSISAPATGGSANGTFTATLVCTQSMVVSMRLQWATPAQVQAGCDANDIGFNAPTVTCKNTATGVAFP